MTQRIIIIILLSGIMSTLSMISYFQYAQNQALQEQNKLLMSQYEMQKTQYEIFMKEQKEKEMAEGLYKGIDELQRATDKAMKQYNN